MRVRVVAVAVAALILLAVAPAFAGETVSRTGWIVDEWCGKNNANAEGAGCTKRCAEKGAEIALYTEGELIKLDDKARALEHVGRKVVVTGVISDAVLHIESIKDADDDA